MSVFTLTLIRTKDKELLAASVSDFTSVSLMRSLSAECRKLATLRPAFLCLEYTMEHNTCLSVTYKAVGAED